MFDKRVVFLPVDERFCTRDYFLLLARAANINVVTPPKSYLGAKKTPPDIRRLLKWLEETVVPGDYLVLSIDMLVHGGLIPSRMSIETLDTLKERLGLLEKLKDRDVKIYATTTVTRTPLQLGRRGTRLLAVLRPGCTTFQAAGQELQGREESTGL